MCKQVVVTRCAGTKSATEKLVVEWTSAPTADMIADSVIALAMHAQASPASFKLSGQPTAACPHDHSKKSDSCDDNGMDDSLKVERDGSSVMESMGSTDESATELPVAMDESASVILADQDDTKPEPLAEKEDTKPELLAEKDDTKPELLAEKDDTKPELSAEMDDTKPELPVEKEQTKQEEEQTKPELEKAARELGEADQDALNLIILFRLLKDQYGDVDLDFETNKIHVRTPSGIDAVVDHASQNVECKDAAFKLKLELTVHRIESALKPIPTS